MALGKKDWPQANVIADMLRHDYKPFYLALREYYQIQKPGSADIKDIDRNLGLIQRAMVLIPRVYMGQGHTAPSLKEVDELNELLETIESSYASTVKMAINEKNQQMMEAAKYASDMTGINPEAMSLAKDLQERAAREAKTGKKDKGQGLVARSALGTALHAVGLTPRQGAIAYAGAQIAAPLLGPLFGAVYPMMIAATKIGSKIGGKLLGLGGRGIKGAARGVWRGMKHRQTIPPLREDGDTPAPKIPLDRKIPYLTKKEPAVPYTEKKAVADPTPMQTALRSHVGMPVVRKGGKRGHAELKAAAEPLFYFFDKMAHRAKWTKAVLKALKRGGGKGSSAFDDEGDDTGTGVFKGMLAGTALGRLISNKKFWTGMLKFAGLGVSLYLLYTQVDRVTDTFKEWNTVSKKVQAELEKNLEMQQEFRAKEREIKLAEIKASDMSPEEKRKANLAQFKAEGAALSKDEVKRFEALPPWEQGLESWKAGYRTYNWKSLKNQILHGKAKGIGGEPYPMPGGIGGEPYPMPGGIGGEPYPMSKGIGGKYDPIWRKWQRDRDEKRTKDMTLNPTDDYGSRFTDPSDLAPSPYTLPSPFDQLPVEGKYDKQMLDALEGIEKKLGQSTESAEEPPMQGPYGSSDPMIDQINSGSADSLGN